MPTSLALARLPLCLREAKGAFKMEPNPDFAQSAQARLQQKGLIRDAKVLVMCRSGSRSAKAADTLTAAGFTQVYSVVGL